MPALRAVVRFALCLFLGGGFAGLASAQTGTFTPTGNLSTARGTHTATLLNNGQVLLVGGWDNNNNAIASAELYDPVSGTF